MTRALVVLGPERLGLLLSIAVGLAIGAQLIRGGFDSGRVMWAAIAVLGLALLRILVRRWEAERERAR